MKRVRAHLSLREGAIPRYLHPSPIPFAYQGISQQRIGPAGSIQYGILEKVDRSDWAAPIVPVSK